MADAEAVVDTAPGRQRRAPVAAFVGTCWLRRRELVELASEGLDEADIAHLPRFLRCPPPHLRSVRSPGCSGSNLRLSPLSWIAAPAWCCSRPPDSREISGRISTRCVLLLPARANLSTGTMLRRDNEDLVLGPRGARLAALMLFYRHLIGMPDGEGG